MKLSIPDKTRATQRRVAMSLAADASHTNKKARAARVKVRSAHRIIAMAALCLGLTLGI